MRTRIVFDLDGTLIDSAPDIRAVANAVLAPHGGQITLAQTHMFAGNGVEVFITRMLKALDLPHTMHADMVPMFKSAYLTAVDQTRIYAGVTDALTTLRAQGHALGICTNKPLAPCMAVMDHLGLSQYFETFWAGDSLTVNKPDPAPLNAAFDALGDGPLIYIGDSEVDAQTAVSARVPFLLYSQGYHKTPLAEIPHTAIFDDYGQLPDLVTQYAVSP